jgi:hypothetical protein
MPPAPGLFSTITCWPSERETNSPIRRELKSNPQ